MEILFIPVLDMTVKAMGGKKTPFFPTEIHINKDTLL